MKETYVKVAEMLETGEPFALATLIRSRGSAPQVAGSQAMFHPDGRSDGNLGGGCLEMEARRRALTAMASGEPTFFSLHLDSDFGFDDGLICGGTADILIEPRPQRFARCFEAAADAVRRRQDAGVATICDGPRGILGARAVIEPGRASMVDGTEGDLAETLLEHATRAAERRFRQPEVVDVPGASIFVEPLLRSPELLIVGAGHVGTALSRLASRLDFEVVALDDRPAFANADRLPWASRVIAADIPSTLEKMDLAPDTYVVIMTRGHRHDGAALRACLGRPLAYLGMIGSRRKIRLIYDELLEEGAAQPEELARIRSPIGLDIGAESVEEIAVSIAAELILVRHSTNRTPDSRPLFESMSELIPGRPAGR
ncbi:MAG TPA: XdhC family protein [Armatimonadota bacterium]|nr:XdhC family protein [Armatimonadota bacterium]